MTIQNELLNLLRKMGRKRKSILLALEASERSLLIDKLALEQPCGIAFSSVSQSGSELYFAELPPALRSKLQLLVSSFPAEGSLRPEAFNSLQSILAGHQHKSE